MTGAGLYAVYDRFAGRSFQFDDRLLSPTLLLPVAALLLIYFMADGLRLHYTLKALGHRLPLRKIFRLVFINLFFSNVTPMATGGGFAQIWYLTRHGVPVARATAAEVRAQAHRAARLERQQQQRACRLPPSMRRATPCCPALNPERAPLAWPSTWSIRRRPHLVRTFIVALA